MLKILMRITSNKIIINHSQNKYQIQHSNFTKEDKIKFKTPIHRVIHNKDSKEIWIHNRESIGVNHQIREYHKISNKFSLKFNKTVDIWTPKIMKVQKEVKKEYNKKCRKLTMKDFTHQINNHMMFTIITFYTKTQGLVEETMSSQFRTFINVKITPNKLMQKRWKK